MDPTLINTIIQAFTLNQRNVTCQFRKEYGLYRTHLEILTLANTVVCFNAYEVHKRYKEMNMQQIRVGIRKMVHEGYIELVGYGKRNSPSIYMITFKGKQLVDDYNLYWVRTFYPDYCQSSPPISSSISNPGS